MKAARVAVAALALAACGWLAAWGCASQGDVGIREHDWQHHVPDGGWARFVPAERPYEPNPNQAAAGGVPSVGTLPTVPSGIPHIP